VLLMKRDQMLQSLKPMHVMQVLDDNVYELRSRQHEASTALARDIEGPAEGDKMQIEEPAHSDMPEAVNAPGSSSRPAATVTEAAGADAAAGSSGKEQDVNGVTEPSSAEREPRDEDEEQRTKKRVRFAEPWLPPHRRDDDKGGQLR
jgi:hypothetical protein